MLIKDLSRIIPEPAPKATEHLYQTWQQEFDKIESDEKSVERVTREVTITHQAVLQALSQLK